MSQQTHCEMISQSTFLHIIETELNIPPAELIAFKAMPNDELYTVLVQKFQIKETVLFAKLTPHTTFHYQPLSDIIVDPQFKQTFTQKELLKYRFLPIYSDSISTVIGIDNPFNPIVDTFSDTFSTISNTIEPIYITSTDMARFFNSFDTPQLETESVLNTLLREAMNTDASDIHIYRTQSGATIRFRKNGQMIQHDTLNLSTYHRLSNLIKVHSHMDVSISTHPQDGRMTYSNEGQSIDIRTASLPTIFGEDFVLRIFQSHSSAFYSLNDLGMNSSSLTVLKRLLKLQHGLILVTGPTGSGKTTTLYSCLNEIKSYSKQSIVTLEDPVEKIIPDVRQSPIKTDSAYTFSKGLRAILRQDPDIIMIGEIRDSETAEIALHAAYTGHLVLSSLHTHDVKTSLLRLLSFGLDPFLISYGLKGIFSQQLILTHCKHCQSTGCKECHYTGGTSRTMLSETLEVTTPYQLTPSSESIDQFIHQNHFIPYNTDIQTKMKHALHPSIHSNDPC